MISRSTHHHEIERLERLGLWSHKRNLSIHRFAHRTVDAFIGIGSYVAGIVFQLPFIHTKLYTGSIAKILGGVDLSWIAGLIFTAVIYFICTKLFAKDSKTLKVSHSGSSSVLCLSGV